MKTYESKTLLTDHNLREILPQFSYDFPVAVYSGSCNETETITTYMIPWHWHPELEINIIIGGEEKHCYGDESAVLCKGEGIIINANTLHMSKQIVEGSAHISLLFHSSLLGGHPQSVIEKKYMQPVTNCGSLKGMRLSPTVAWQAGILDLCWEIHDAYKEKAFSYELFILQKLASLWQTFVLNTQEIIENNAYKKPSPDVERVKTMMRYIHTRYAENPSLNDIAASAGLSISECCRCFKRVLDMTPFSYLIQYRLDTAARLMRDTGKAISEVAEDVGFDTESYFSRKFKDFFGCTPSQYRKNPALYNERPSPFKNDSLASV